MPRESRTALPALVLYGFLISAHARSWDFAVTIGREVNFFATNRTSVGQTQIAEAEKLTSLAYDETEHTMYLSDARGNMSIFSYNLTENKVRPKPLLRKQKHSHIMGLAYDASSRTLFWTDGLRQVIMRMDVPPDERPGDPVILHNLTDRGPCGIALDVCNRRIYWTNSNSSNPSIESSNLDGSDRAIVINDDLYEPLGLAVDHSAGKLYWIDDKEGVNFKIERSNLNGTDREVLLHTRNQQPAYLAVDSEFIYWSHSGTVGAVWVMPKDANRNGDRPEKINMEAGVRFDPTGIITRDNVGNVDCAKRPKFERINALPSPQPTIESYNNLTTSTEEIDLDTDKSTRRCLNNGVPDYSNRGSCKCKTGYSGAFCEVSLCYNYCFKGDCIVNGQNVPSCKCAPGFAGTRCERRICDGYCLHGGRCSVVDGKPVCTCKDSRGDRCEILLRELVETCAIVCASVHVNSVEIDRSYCRCNETNATAANVVAGIDDSRIDNFKYSTLLPIFTALVIVLLLIIAVLSFYVNKFRRRPRIKKRFVVRKNGVTPLTSRPQIPDNQCEITIENCCNMNICETPCFEPNLRTTVSRSNSTKKEEKNSLLDNMEGNSC